MEKEERTPEGPQEGEPGTDTGTGQTVDPEDEHGNTPLCRAVFESRGRGEIIRLFRDHGADETHRNKHGVSPIELACRIANFDVLQWMT